MTCFCDESFCDENGVVSGDENGVVSGDENGVVSGDENGVVSGGENGVVSVVILSVYGSFNCTLIYFVLNLEIRVAPSVNQEASAKGCMRHPFAHSSMHRYLHNALSP